MKLDPKSFNLPARTALEQVDEGSIAIVIERKSRIIMADGRKILEKARKIQEVRPAASVMLKTTAPICSKTVKFLEEQGIRILAGG